MSSSDSFGWMSRVFSWGTKEDVSARSESTERLDMDGKKSPEEEGEKSPEDGIKTVSKVDNEPDRESSNNNAVGCADDSASSDSLINSDNASFKETISNDFDKIDTFSERTTSESTLDDKVDEPLRGDDVSESSFRSTREKMPEVLELTSDESAEDLSGCELNAVFARCDEQRLRSSLAPVYSSIVKRSPEVPDPDWSTGSESSFVSKSALTSLAYWDSKVQRLRRERRKRTGSKSSWKAFRNWWEKELKAAHIVQDTPKLPASPASIRGSRILSMVVDETQQDILLEQLQVTYHHIIYYHRFNQLSCYYTYKKSQE